MGTHARIPLVPDPSAANRAFIRSFTRAAVSSMRSAVDRTQTAESFARKAYPDDGDIPRLLKAAVSPHATTGDSASALVAQSMALLDALMPVSASAALLRQTKVLGWDPGVGSVSVPTLDMTAALPTWIAEGKPYQVPQATSTALYLKPHKWGTIVAFTIEMLAHSQADVLAQQALTAGIGYALDQSLFSANAAVLGLSPAGLLNGLSSLPPTALTTFTNIGAMVADLAKLAAAVAPVAINGPTLFVCSPAQAAAAKIYRPELADTILASAALAPATAIAIAPAALAVCTGAPSFEPSHNGTVHMSTTPADIGTPGSPPVVAAPVVSAWQSGLVLLKFRWMLDWGLRTKPAQPNGPPPGVAFISPTNW
jgi:hypothetical protein